MKFQKNISLKPYNTFGIDVQAKDFIEVTSFLDLQKVISNHKDFFILSGGSNMLLTKDIETLVIHLNNKGISIAKENENSVEVCVQAGENWHQFVVWCLEQNYGGLENLSLIPGNVGTSPIQNIGAYGVEVKDVITQVEALEVSTGNKVIFSNANCQFGYRNSVFKNELKGKYIVTSVNFLLSKSSHNLNTSYGAIEKELEVMDVTDPTIQDVSQAVITIRSSKLPDPKEIGNSGSFFKNPVISKQHFERLVESYPNIPSYPVSKTEIKVPAGWLIEQAGFKGQRFGDAGVHKKQALVLVNYGNATGSEIHELALNIQQKINAKFDIDLEMEVNVI